MPVPVAYSLSLPQSLHVCTPESRKSATTDGPVMYVPAAHGVWVELPSHEWPASHAVHVVRVFTVPPLVNDPARHVSHQALAVALGVYDASLLQFVQEPAPCASAVPATHAVCVEVPSHEWPASHAVHVSRVLVLSVLLTLLVNEVAPHVLHAALPVPVAYSLSLLHAVSVAVPPAQE